MMNVDKALEELGSWGRFQLINYSLICLPIIFTAMFSLCYVFTAGLVPHRCLVPECDGARPRYAEEWLAFAVPSRGEGGAPSGCLRYLAASPAPGPPRCAPAAFSRNATAPCGRWVFEDSETTVASEFGIACDNEWKRTVVGTVYAIGQFIGMPIAGVVSDRIGRKTILVSGLVLVSLVGLARSMAWSYESYLFLSFLDAVAGSGVYTSCFVLGVELVGPDRRVLAASLLSMFYAVGEALLGALARGVRSWRRLLLAVHAPALLFASYRWMIPESVRWLTSQGREDEALDILLKAARTNGIVLSEAVLNKPEHCALVNEEKSSICEDGSSKSSDSVFLQVLKSRILLLRFINCCFCWLANTFVFYGLTLNSVAVGGDKYASFVMAALAEVPGYVAAIFVMRGLGRRVGLAASLCGSGAAVLAACFVPADLQAVRTACFMTSKLLITLSFTVLYVHTAEMFPTPLRHSAISAGCMVGRFGSMVAPQTPLLARYSESLPLLLLGAAAVLAGGLALLFPETLGALLPDTVAQAERVGRGGPDKSPLGRTASPDQGAALCGP
ncbi:organic cation transporter protein-like isoform X2 [Bacillus rossius redtenbacheri]